jgi:hypothetical protein
MSVMCTTCMFPLRCQAEQRCLRIADGVMSNSLDGLNPPPTWAQLDRAVAAERDRCARIAEKWENASDNPAAIIESEIREGVTP